jgi:hypothetical protein
LEKMELGTLRTCARVPRARARAARAKKNPPALQRYSRLCASHKMARPIVHNADAERASVHTIMQVFGARAGLG